MKAPGPPSPRISSRAAWAAVSIVAAGVAVFARSCGGGWLWDDDQYITQNPLLRSAAGLGRIWLGRSGVNYFPLTSTAEWLEWRLWGDRPLGYHVVTLALHLAAALLVWRVALALLREAGHRQAEGGAWLAGLFFAVHPLTVESVAWVSELKNTLSLTLVLLAMRAWLRERLRATWGWFLLALLSKSTVVPFPLVLLLHRGWRRGGLAWTDAVQVAPGLLLSALLGGVTVWLERTRAIGLAATPLEGLGQRAVAAGLAAAFYLGKCLWPVGLAPIYPRWSVTPVSAGQALVWPLIALTAVVLWRRRRGPARHGLFAGAAFLVLLLPVLGLVPMAYLRLAWVADHFAYLALVCCVIGAGAVLAAGWRAGVAAGAVLAALMAVASAIYVPKFRSAEALWTRTLDVNPGAWSAHNDLGAIRYDQGRLPEALREFQAAVALHPEYPEAWNNLGAALMRSDRLEEAASAYDRALSQRPNYAAARCNRGNVRLRQGRLAEAVADYTAALSLQAPFPEAHYNRGLALRALGRETEAAADFRAAGFR